MRAIERSACRSWLLEAGWASERLRVAQRVFGGGKDSTAEAQSRKQAGQGPVCEDVGPEGKEKGAERRKDPGEGIRFDLGTGTLGEGQGKILGTGKPGAELRSLGRRRGLLEGRVI